MYVIASQYLILSCGDPEPDTQDSQRGSLSALPMIDLPVTTMHSPHCKPDAQDGRPYLVTFCQQMEQEEKGTEGGRRLAFVARVDHVTSRSMHAIASDALTCLVSRQITLLYSGQR